jgi:hypothetical protein
VNHRHYFRLSIAFLGVSSMAAHSQTDSPPQPAQPPAIFQSAMEGYKPYTDDKTVDWKAANDTTASIGGWRAYAKEAAAPAVQASPPSAPPAATDTPKVKP